MNYRFLLFSLFLTLLILPVSAQVQKEFDYMDGVELEYTGDPQISPDGNYIVYRRTGFDIMKDRSAGNLWILSADGTIHHKLTSFEGNERNARWSPNSDRIAFVRK